MPGKLTAFLRFAPVAVLAFLVGCVVDGPPPPGPGAGFCTREYAPVCGARFGDRQTFPNACEADRAGYRIIRDGRCGGGFDRPRPERPRYCPSIYDPVCARRGGDRRTFGNSCEADRAGYDVIRGGTCRRNEGPISQPDRPRPDRPDRPRPDRPGPDRPRPEEPRPPRPDRPRPEEPRPDRPRPEQPRPDRPQAEQPRPPRPSTPPPATQACTREYAPVCAGVGGGTRTFANACEARAAGGAIVKRGAC